MADDVHTLDGPLLLLAGPGTGKTYRLARRLKHLVEARHVDPASIAAVTFTAAAAAELRERISDPDRPELYIARELQPASIGTLHAFGHALVRAHHRALGLPAEPAVLADDRMRDILLGDAAQLAGQPRAAADDAERCRRHGGCRPEDAPRCTVCRAYGTILAACGAVDFDDQVILACRLLRADPALAAATRARTRHLLVDEYQDINEGQHDLVRLLTEGQSEGLFAVGDDDQSIYAFRGGSPAFIRGFADTFGPGARVEALHRSRRCPRAVLEGALAIVRQYDPGRLDKGAMAFDAGGGCIHVHDTPSARAEADAVVRVVRHAGAGAAVLVLVPTRPHGALVAERLRAARIPCATVEPPPGSGLAVLARLAAWLRAGDDALALRGCIADLLDGPAAPLPGPRSRSREKIAAREEGLGRVAGLWRDVVDRRCPLWEALQARRDEPVLREVCAALEELRAGAGEVATVLASALRLLRPWSSPEALWTEVEGWTGRANAAPPAEGAARVRLTTVQGAKGLEADVVCVLGLEEGAFPRAAGGAALAEQARLMLVAMTRARRELHLLHARTRSGAVSHRQLHGPDGRHTLEPSRFLAALPDEHVERHYERGRG